MNHKNLVCAIFLLLISCSPKVRHAGLIFRDWYVVKPTVGATMTAAYGSIENTLATPALLKSITFDCAVASEMHETVETQGRVSMQKLGEIAIAAGASVKFEPGHKHVMLMGVRGLEEKQCLGHFIFGAQAVALEISINERPQ